MTTPSIVDPATVLTNALGDASPDLMRTLLQTMINTLLSAEADAICGTEPSKVFCRLVLEEDISNGQENRSCCKRTRDPARA